MVNYGGLGKHFYDVTYMELYWFYRVWYWFRKKQIR